MEIDTKALATVKELEAVPAIKNTDDYLVAVELWKAGRAMMEQISAAYDTIIAAAHKTHKEAVAKKKSFFDPVETATKRIKGLMSIYDAEQERKRREEVARLEAEARKREEERKLAEAIAVEQAGDRVAADAIMEEEITLPPVYVPKSVPKVAGVVYREVWKFRIVDSALVPREYLAVDEVKLGGVVRSTKGSLKIPGVEVYSEEV